MNRPSAVSIPVSGMVDGSPAQFVRFVIGQVRPVSTVQDAVGVRLPRAHATHVVRPPRSIVVDIVESGALMK